MCLLFVFLVTFSGLSHSSGLLSNKESLIQRSFCDLDTANIDCGSSAEIAPQLMRYGYRQTCSASCCEYDPVDCLVNVTNTEDLIRACSGKQSCSVPISKQHVFCAFGNIAASYMYLEYYCIPDSRRMSVASSGTVTSSGAPIYITNEGYPGVTIGSGTWSCSFEAQSCYSMTSYYVIDADLYRNQTSCSQSLQFTDQANTVQGTIQCENYYSQINLNTIRSNYIRIQFDSNSTSNLEGFFFLGFAASEDNVTFSISCPPKSPTWCKDCGTPSNITNGKVELVNPVDSGYNASAFVTCVTGFEPNKSVIACKEKGIWESAECKPTDCGVPAQVSFGTTTVDSPGNTTYTASARVKCNTGYNTNTNTIICQANGTWGHAECSVIASFCDQPPLIDHGSIVLDIPGNTTYQATATVTCQAGYVPSREKTTCLGTRMWQTVKCKENGTEELSASVSTSSSGKIIGGVIGGLVSVGIIVGIVIVIVRKKLKCNRGK